MLFIFTKNGTRYIFDDRLAVAEDIVNGDTEYCFAHWLARFVA